MIRMTAALALSALFATPAAAQDTGYKVERELQRYVTTKFCAQQAVADFAGIDPEAVKLTRSEAEETYSAENDVRSAFVTLGAAQSDRRALPVYTINATHRDEAQEGEAQQGYDTTIDFREKREEYTMEIELVGYDDLTDSPIEAEAAKADVVKAGNTADAVDLAMRMCMMPSP
jgi:hypothetical protein